MARLPESNNLLNNIDHRIENKKYNRKVKFLNQTFSFYESGIWNIFGKIENYNEQKASIKELDEYINQIKIQFTLLNKKIEPVLRKHLVFFSS